MRWVLWVSALGLAGGVVRADPIGEGRLLERIRTGTAEARAEAATTLATWVERGDPRTLEVVKAAVLSDDPAVRAPLLGVLIARRVLDRPSAARVPTASVLDTQLRRLLPKEAPDQLPHARDCRLTSGTRRAAVIACQTSRCQDACVHERRTFEISAGVRWTITEVQVTRADDGSCGDCL